MLIINNKRKSGDKLLTQLQEIVDYLSETMADPVPQYILKKEILHTSPTEADITRLKESKWYRQLAAEQWDNGSWGRFHTQDTKLQEKRKFVTTEAALRRARELSLDQEDELIDKAIQLMERYVEGQEEWLDTIEHHYGFEISFRAIVTANLSLFDPKHPLVQTKKEICATNLSKAMRHGVLDEAVWEQENRNSNEILLRPYMVYVIWLLENNDYLDQERERDFLNYIWHRKDGIYYCTSGPISDPKFLESKDFSTWLAGLENLSSFTLFPEFMNRGTADHLINEVHRLMYSDVLLPNASPLFGHYSETWSSKNSRKNDMILRILRVLIPSLGGDRYLLHYGGGTDERYRLSFGGV